MPLLKFIEDTINKNIINEFNEKYYFQFVGGDVSAEAQKIAILAEEGSIAKTVNEIRKDLGLQGDIAGGDIPLNGVIVQRLGQIMQQEQFDYQRKQDNLNRLLENTGAIEGESSGITFQDYQQGLAGNSDNVNGKGTTGKVGKDGQVKDQQNTNSMGQGSLNKDK